MIEILNQSLRLLLEELGIDEKQQFMWMVVACLAGFVVYSVRERHRHGLLFTALFMLLALCALVFLFTESEAARHWSALMGSLTIAAIFGWEFVRRRRLTADLSSDDGGLTTE